MQYLSEQHILELHAVVLGATRGTHGVRDAGLLKSIVERPKAAYGGEEMYPDVYQKAAVYLEAVVNYHVFVDGNKRTAVLVAARFLAIHNIECTATQKELVALPLWVATEKPEIQEIATRLRHLTKEEKGA